MKTKQILLAVAALLLIGNSIYQTIEIHRLKTYIVSLDSSVDILDAKISSIDDDVDEVKSTTSEIKEHTEDIESNVEDIFHRNY